MRIRDALLYAPIALASARAGAQGSISGTVFDSLSTRAPLANATVVLVERSRYVTTDARGHFQIDSVPDGRYTIGFMHPLLDSLDVSAGVVPVTVSGGRTVVTLATPTRAATYARLCSDRYDAETGVVAGRVRDVDDRSPLANATVSTDWTEYTLSGGHTTGHRVTTAARTNAEGRYVLCGVPTTVPVDVITEFGDVTVGPVPLLLQDRLIGHLDFAVSTSDTAARTVAHGDSVALASGVVGTASLHGTVLGGDGRPMRDAVVAVLGTPLSVHTDGSGVFRVDGIPAGTRAVEVRSIGSVPTVLSMDFATNGTRDTIVTVGLQPQALRAVSVRESNASTSLMDRDGFDKRRLQGLGAFRTADEVSRHGYSDLGVVLADMRGIHFEIDRKGRRIPYLLGVNSVRSSPYCTPNFFLDGAPYADGFDILFDIVPPEFIRGIEVYSNPGTIPPQYDLTSSTGCGSIVIWTR